MKVSPRPRWVCCTAQMAGCAGPAEHVVAPVRLVVRGSTRGGA